jgi:molybdate transport system regulatory protein
MLKPRLNVWIESDGDVALSVWRVQFLETLAETGSINATAARLNLSYRRAWDKLREMEQRLGVRLVDRRTGGTRGGGVRLTPAGEDYVRRFHRFYDGLPELLARRFPRAFE